MKYRFMLVLLVLLVILSGLDLPLFRGGEYITSGQYCFRGENIGLEMGCREIGVEADTIYTIMVPSCREFYTYDGFFFDLVDSSCKVIQSRR